MRLRAIFTAALTGALIVGSVWAGVGLSPISVRRDDAVDTQRLATKPAALTAEVPAGIGDDVQLGDDEALAGAAKVDLEPTPDESAGEVWVRDRDECVPAGTGGVDPERALTHVADPRTPWIENSNCIYMGGFGIGPSQPVIEWDAYEPETPVYGGSGDINPRGYGLWARSFAVARGGQTFVMTILDGEGYFAAYNRLCGSTPCGIHALQEQLAAELGSANPALGITRNSFVVGSTHAHSGMDFIGGWGAVPQWYMDQVAEAIRASVREAIASMVPATLEVGESLARQHNSERRDTYRSAEDPTVNWLRAYDRDGAVVATVGAFAAHATSFGGSATLAHADWPGVFEKRVEERFGGVGLMFEAGLGNMSTRGGYRMGARVADLLPGEGGGSLIPKPDVQVRQTFWDQPVTNGPLGTLGAGGFFDRPFSGPAVVEAGKSSSKPCRSASAVSAHVSASAARIGQVRHFRMVENPETGQLERVDDPQWPDFLITTAPGEIFANYSNTVEEQASLGAMVFGQTNDALGYMPQSFETDHVARQGTGFAGLGVFEYEDAYSIDACFGDVTLENTMAMIGQMRTAVATP